MAALALRQPKRWPSGRRGRAPSAQPAPSAWGWALGGALAGLALATVLFAPARWLALALNTATGGHVQLLDAEGTVWRGSARVLLAGGAASQGSVALPGRVDWRLRPVWPGASLLLKATKVNGIYDSDPKKNAHAKRYSRISFDQVLADEQMVAAVYEALGKRHPKSRSRGRLGTPAEVVLRLLILKHIRNWSYGVLEREVRANLVYRDFTRVGGAKTPDAKTMGRWGVALGGDVIKQIHIRMVTMAQSHGLTEGRRMRVDTTVVETNIHYPTDSSLLGDGVRVLIRTMKKITQIVGEAGTKLRDRSRGVKFRLLEIGRVARAKGSIDQDKLKRRYGRLLDATSRVVGQAKRFSNEVAEGVKRSADMLQQLALDVQGGLLVPIERGI